MTPPLQSAHRLIAVDLHGLLLRFYSAPAHSSLLSLECYQMQDTLEKIMPGVTSAPACFDQSCMTNEQFVQILRVDWMQCLQTNMQSFFSVMFASAAHGFQQLTAPPLPTTQHRSSPLRTSPLTAPHLPHRTAPHLTAIPLLHRT